MNNQINVAIDGFASCGKSTLARDLAKKLGYVYIDSGAMYRAAMLYFLDNNIDIEDEQALISGLKKINISFKVDDKTGNNEVWLNGNAIEYAIREMRISRRVSELSKIKAVREYMVKIQQDIGKEKGIVMDGRDIGTVVFPNAKLKLFMTADFDERVRRRYDELKAKGVSIEREDVAQNLQERDHIDTHRKESPLIKANDAIEIDNTNLSPKDQLEMIVKLAEERIG